MKRTKSVWPTATGYPASAVHEARNHPASSDCTLAHGVSKISRARLWLGLIVANLALSPTLFAGDTLRCGNRLVEAGDSMEKVRALCGEPNDVSRSRLWRRRNVDPIGYRLHDAQHRDHFTSSEWVETIEVQLETWTYNFGPNLFMRRVRFADGILEGIETLGYGHND